MSNEGILPSCSPKSVEPEIDDSTIMRPRRSPSSITLVLIGTAALYGCGAEEPGARRDIYRSRPDCQQDWGADPNRCEPVRSGAHSGYFYGPRYRDDGPHGAGTTTLPRSGSSAIGTAHLGRGDTARASTTGSSSSGTSRGGFGSSASSFSSGG